MATVFTIAGMGDPSSVWGDILPSTLEFQMQGKITAGNDVVNIVYPGLIAFDAMLLAAGPMFIPAEDLPSIAAGVDALDIQINNVAGDKIVFCHSLGCVVASQWLQQIGPTSDIPPSDLTFVFMGNPVRRYGGIVYAESYAAPADTPYTVTDYKRQYDYFADFPNVYDSPYYIEAVANAIAGWPLVHPFYMAVDPTDTTLPRYTEGNITYVMSPTRPFWMPEYLLPFIEDAYDRPEGTSEFPPIPQSDVYGPSVRYPAGPITPHGAYMLLNDRIPNVKLRSYDDSIVFNMMGGEAIPDRQLPERVELNGIKGLVPPWQTIDQKGATQDGVTFIDALYDPIEVTLDVVAHGRDPMHCRKVQNHLVAAIDAKQESELSWFTHEAGRWWAPVRWFKTPDHDFKHGKRQKMSLRLRADKGFWESYPNVEEFRFGYNSGLDTFSTNHPTDLGTHWTIHYSTSGTGNIYTENGEVKSTLNNRTATARFDTGTATDNQVVEVQVGNLQQWFYPIGAAIDVWLRQGTASTPGQDGIRFRVENFVIIVSSFTAGVETVLWLQPMVVPPLPGETFTFIAGTPEVTVPMSVLSKSLDDITIPASPREYRVMRDGAPMLTFKEPGTTSQMGANFRGVGLGFQAGFSLFPELLDAIPANIRKFSFSDNAEINQTGFIKRINAGDQEAWDRYTCFGPGLFRIGNGPESSDMVQFGPLLPNQVMQIRTDPRKYGVKDLGAATTPTTPAASNILQKLLGDFLSFATSNNVPPFLRQIESWLGIVPPQGNPYQLLKGRFSNPIPAKSPGKPAVPHHIKIEIDNGNADTKVIAALTPLRRYPF